MDAADPVFRLEHDHTHLSRLIDDLRRTMSETVSTPDAGDDLATLLRVLLDDLVDHFAREEEGLFPYLVAKHPDLRPSIDELSLSHDGLCGAAARLYALASKGGEATSDQGALVHALFSRLDLQYVDHARRESELLRAIALRLDAEERASLTKILASL